MVGGGGVGGWPSSGGTNTITWNAGTNCQRTEIGGEGVHAVAGAFYVYAYSPDHLAITPVDVAFAVKDCLGSTSYSYYTSPRVIFSASGYEYGENPCLISCRGSISPTVVYLGARWVGTTRDSTVVIHNSGDFTVSGTWSVTGSAFALVSPTGPFRIGPGQQAPVTVRFAPMAYGPATRSLYTGGPCWRSIPLTGVGVSTCSFTPPSLSFAQVTVGEAETLSVVLTNIHKTTLGGTIQITGDDFGLGLGDNTLALALGDSMFVPVVFRPMQAGTRTGTVFVGTTCGRVALSGEALPSCNVEPPSFDFGKVGVGTFRDKEFVLTSNLHEPFNGQVSVSGSRFRVVDGVSPFLLGYREWHYFTIRFEPQEIGKSTGTVSFGTPCASIGVAGTGRAPTRNCRVLPSANENLGFVPVGGYRTLTLHLINSGEAPVEYHLNEEGLRPNFSLLDGGGDFVVAVRDTHDVRVRYAPLALGTHVGTLDTGSPCGTVRVSGYATGCRIRPGPEMAFGLLQMGASRTQTFRFVGTSEGPIPLNLNGDGLRPAFSLPNGEGPFTIPPGDTLDVPVRYTPLTLGSHSGTLDTGLPCGLLKVEGSAQFHRVACLIDDPVLAFGDVPLGSSRDLQFRFFNYTGALAVGQLSMDSEEFSIMGDLYYQLEWGDSLTTTVRFTPVTPGPLRAVIQVSGPCADSVEATGRGIVPPDTSRARPWIHAASSPIEGVQRLACEVFATASVRVLVFNVAGHEIARFDQGVRVPGPFEITWDARSRPGGIYFTRIEAGQASLTRRILLLR